MNCNLTSHTKYKVYSLVRRLITIGKKQFCCTALYTSYRYISRDTNILPVDYIVECYFPEFIGFAPRGLKDNYSLELTINNQWWEEDDKKSRLHALHICRILVRRQLLHKKLVYLSNSCNQ